MKGQAFDTFKLLIAAVIAVAILGILLSIMSGIILPGADSQQVIGEQLKKASQFPHSTFISQAKASFQAGNYLSASSFTDALGGSSVTIAFQCSDDLSDACKITTDKKLHIVSVFTAYVGACCTTPKACTVVIGDKDLSC